MRLKVPVLLTLPLLAVMFACSRQSQTPVSPSGVVPPGDAAAAADGSTLKATAPALVSPASGATVTLTPTLTIGASTGTFVTGTFQYQIVVVNAAGNVVFDSGALAAGVLSVTVPAGLLADDTAYSWRARAVSGSAIGPWSAFLTFRTPVRPPPPPPPPPPPSPPTTGFNRPNELYDPLTNGTTIGAALAVTFLPGRGARIDGLTSVITYQLMNTLTSGEYSFEAENISTTGPGDKTKIMSMQEGNGDITANRYRGTWEKRWDGTLRFRIISGHAEDLVFDSVRSRIEFDRARSYLFKVTWGGNVNQWEIFDLTAGGRRVYLDAIRYGGTYRPDPHFAYVGAPVGRNGPVDASVPGFIARHVWISNQPRPANLGVSARQ